MGRKLASAACSVGPTCITRISCWQRPIKSAGLSLMISCTCQRSAMDPRKKKKSKILPLFCRTCSTLPAPVARKTHRNDYFLAYCASVCWCTCWNAASIQPSNACLRAPCSSWAVCDSSRKTAIDAGFACLARIDHHEPPYKENCDILCAKSCFSVAQKLKSHWLSMLCLRKLCNNCLHLSGAPSKDSCQCYSENVASSVLKGSTIVEIWPSWQIVRRCNYLSLLLPKLSFFKGIFLHGLLVHLAQNKCQSKWLLKRGSLQQTSLLSCFPNRILFVNMFSWMITCGEHSLSCFSVCCLSCLLCTGVGFMMFVWRPRWPHIAVKCCLLGGDIQFSNDFNFVTQKP